MRNLWGGALVLVQNKWSTASKNTLLQQQVWFPVGKALQVRLKVLRRSTLVIPVLSWPFYESASFSTSGLAMQHLLLLDCSLHKVAATFFRTAERRSKRVPLVCPCWSSQTKYLSVTLSPLNCRPLQKQVGLVQEYPENMPLQFREQCFLFCPSLCQGNVFPVGAASL